MRRIAAVLFVLIVLALASPAAAFCGFYVAGADAKLFNDATVVVLMRDGKRTVLSMQNDYVGPPEQFAMVVPVPVVLTKEKVKTLPREIFERVDRLGAPRLVEYWEQDPCQIADKRRITFGMGQGFGSGTGRLGGGHGGVKVEAHFAVGEYDIVILSAGDSSGLDQWLRDNGYAIPEGAEPLLRPYVAQGSKFFVAKVDPEKVKFEAGRARLSPLRMHYDSDTFALPVRLGLINSNGKQDLIVNIVAPTRYEVANYPNVLIPTNLDVKESARARFGEFYAALFDRAIGSQGNAVVTEYSWAARGCDPCPDSPLSAEELLTLGGDVLPSLDSKSATAARLPTQMTMGEPRVQGTGKLPVDVVRRIVRQNQGRLRLCYENALRTDPSLKAALVVKFSIAANGSVSKASVGAPAASSASLASCVERAFGVLSFPQVRGGLLEVEYPIDFRSGRAVRPASARASGFAADFVLTRLHARYGKDTLGADLVFKEASPIVGGRERRDEQGKLEHGATPAPQNNFQARYAIRHAWTGSLKCDKPVRGVWGGPWPSASGSAAPDTGPLSATRLGTVKRGDLKLASFLIGAAPGEDKQEPRVDVPSEPPPPDNPKRPAEGGNCGCHSAPARVGDAWWALSALAFVALRRRRGETVVAGSPMLRR